MVRSNVIGDFIWFSELSSRFTAGESDRFMTVAVDRSRVKVSGEALRVRFSGEGARLMVLLGDDSPRFRVSGDEARDAGEGDLLAGGGLEVDNCFSLPH